LVAAVNNTAAIRKIDNFQDQTPVNIKILMKVTFFTAIISTDSAMATLVPDNAQEGCSRTKLRIDQPTQGYDQLEQCC